MAKPAKKIKPLKHQKPLVYGVSEKTFTVFKKKTGINFRSNIKKTIKKKSISLKFNTFLQKKAVLLGNAVQLSVTEDLQFLSKLNNFKSIRHKKKLPTRGQRTKTNGKTQKKFRRR
jgi:small subunit ribosomal protein S13